jgi:hypothetical protein
LKIRFVRRDVALVHVTNELGGLVNANGQTLPAHQELSLRVLVKESDGAWRLTAFQNTLIAPFDGPHHRSKEQMLMTGVIGG